jgi:LAO/AO transport system kinase
VPWRGTKDPPTGALSPPGLLAGYAFDTLGTRLGLEMPANGVPLSTLSQYKHVLWLVDATSSQYSAALVQSLFPVTVLRAMSRPGAFNTLEEYVRWGGQVWLAGGGAAYASLAEFDQRSNNQGQLAVFSVSAGELVPGRLLYDMGHIRSAMGVTKAELRMTRSPAAIGGWSGHGTDGTLAAPNYANAPESMRPRDPATDPLPPTRLPSQAALYYPTAFPAGFVIEPNAISEDFDPDPAVERIESALDTLYDVRGAVLPLPSAPVMLYYHGRDNAPFVYTGFEPWDFTRADCQGLFDLVLGDIWKLTKGAPAGGASGVPRASTRRVRPRREPRERLTLAGCARSVARLASGRTWRAGAPSGSRACRLLAECLRPCAEARMPDLAHDELIRRTLAGERVPLARALSWVENEHPQASALLDACFGRTGRAFRLGITGPPGAGKSHAGDADREGVPRARRDGRGGGGGPHEPVLGAARCWAIACACTSSRATTACSSAAWRRAAAWAALPCTPRRRCDVLDAAGFDRILIETVGVGQSELEVAQTADSTAVVLVPESGDAVQAMKAGLMEIADLFVINKSDREGADRAAQAIRSALHLRARGSEWTIPVMLTAASLGRGVPELVQAFERHLAWLTETGTLEGRRRQRLEQTARGARPRAAVGGLPLAGAGGRLARSAGHARRAPRNAQPIVRTTGPGHHGNTAAAGSPRPQAAKNPAD